MLGFSDPGCFDEAAISEEYSRECQNEDDVCMIDVEVDWYFNGKQTVHTRRGCGRPDDLIQGGCTGNFEIFPTPMQVFKAQFKII